MTGRRALERRRRKQRAGRRRFEQHRAIVIGCGRRNAERDQLLAGFFEVLSNGISRGQLVGTVAVNGVVIVQGHAIVGFGFEAGFDRRQAVIRANFGAITV